MSAQTAAKASRPAKAPNTVAARSSSAGSAASVSSHLAMVDLKQRILTSLSKLADRDTYQIAVEDLEKIIQSLSPETIPMLLNCLYDSCSDSKPAVKRESLRLLSYVCSLHGDSTATHLTKIIAQIVKRLKDSDSGVRDACRDAIGSLSGQYLKGKEESNAGVASVVGLFVKPLFEAMAEQNKVVQSGAAMCMAKMVEATSDPPVAAFQKLCPRICKLLNNPNFMAKSSLLPVVASLSQVGAIAPQSLESLLESTHECLRSVDWATRKAAADALSALTLHSNSFIKDKAGSTLSVLEACRFDKIKPVRDSITEALQLWSKIAEKYKDGQPGEQKGTSTQQLESAKESEERSNIAEVVKKESSDGSSQTSESVSKSKAGSIPEKAVVMLKKKAPALTDKELNPEFFQKLEKRGSGDLLVEVVVPHRCKNSSNLNNEEESKPNDTDSRGSPNCFRDSQAHDHGFSNSTAEQKVNVNEQRTRASRDDQKGINQRETSENHASVFNSNAQSEESLMNKEGNWSGIQRQLLQLERQQANLMNMLQEFVGGSHGSMVTLENRVRGLESIVQDMARNLSISSGRSGNFPTGFEGSNRLSGKYNGFSNYPSVKFNGRVSQSGVMRGRAWRCDGTDDWDTIPLYGASRNWEAGSRKSPGSEHEDDLAGNNRRAWDKVAGSVSLGEGPSARSVWQASKDEATLEAIRVVARDDNRISWAGRVAAVPEAEAMGDDANGGRERDPVWTSWSNAMHALRVGDMDSAYAEVLSTGDDLLVVKLMDRTGPVIDELSNEIASEALNAIAQFLLDHNLYDICLSWIQQLLEVVSQEGPDAFGVPMELKNEILLNLQDVSSTMEPPQDWEGPPPEQLLIQLASAWEIQLQQFEK